jgi:hypothetical protein
MIMEMRKRMRKYGGEDGKGRIRRGINQRVHLMKELNLERGQNRETYHIFSSSLSSSSFVAVGGGVIDNN